jgi:hypothetical protein
MYQVTAVVDGCEVGYGEGESLKWAKMEALDNIDSFYRQMISAGYKLSWIIIKN